MVLTIYGSYLCVQTLRSEMVTKKIQELWVIETIDGRRVRSPIGTRRAWVYLLQTEALLAALAVFAAFAAAVVVCFFGYQMSLILRGLTTNESFKLDDLNYDITKGHLKTIPSKLFETNKRFFYGTPVTPVVEPDVSAVGTTDVSESSSVKKRPGKDDNKGEGAAKSDMVTVSTGTRVRHPYSRGAWNNLMEVLFPQPL
ncbi:hypothetical protein HDV00_011356 [Rhizophlyctis rosea]|nr:hypothetical protein HDV00_011356 [Rhizophlyctis rosea]